VSSYFLRAHGSYLRRGSLWIRLHKMMLADGVRPEDCIAWSEIIRMREE